MVDITELNAHLAILNHTTICSVFIIGRAIAHETTVAYVLIFITVRIVTCLRARLRTGVCAGCFVVATRSNHHHVEEASQLTKLSGGAVQILHLDIATAFHTNLVVGTAKVAKTIVVDRSIGGIPSDSATVINVFASHTTEALQFGGGSLKHQGTTIDHIEIVAYAIEGILLGSNQRIVSALAIQCKV